MPLVLVRIDSRLIHGQIIEAWVPYLRSDCILVADDQVASNALQKTIMRMAVPREITVSIDGVRQLVDAIKAGAWENKKSLMLFSNCESAFKAYEYGLEFSFLNVGNLHYAPDSKQITPSICLKDGEISCLRQMEKDGIRVELRAVPRHKPIHLNQIKIC